MSTVLWTVYLAIMVFNIMKIIFDLCYEDSVLDEDDWRIYFYVSTAIMIAIWYMYFLH